MRLSKSEFLAIKRKAQARKTKRQAKAKELWGRVKRTSLKARLDSVFSLFIRARDIRANGGLCRICNARPIECCYHLVPKSEGMAIRWEPLNAVGACAPCNDGERFWRLRYREKHVKLFGQELMDKLWAQSKETVQFSDADLQDKIMEFTVGLNRKPGLQDGNTP